MLRQGLQYLSDSGVARRVVTGARPARRLAERFVAGETLDEAIAAARTLNDAGFRVSLDHLGELVISREESLSAVDMALRCLERIDTEGLDANLSLKLSQLGLEIEEEFCHDNVARILERARQLGDGEDEIFVRLDMESSDYTEQTIRLVERLRREGFRNVGAVVQSSLRRTPDDIERLNRIRTRVRLVKGAYLESSSIAFLSKTEVDRMFAREMETLLLNGLYPAIATHDEAMISATRRFAFENGIPRGSFEFQMLYGIRRDLQRRLREEGHDVRVYLPFGDAWYPYLMRRLAERPANLLFVASSLAKESPAGRIARPIAVGAGVVAGALAATAWRARNGKA